MNGVAATIEIALTAVRPRSCVPPPTRCRRWWRFRWR
jgi:hypothetical protein